MFKKIPYRITGITGIELGEHAHHMNPSYFYFLCEYHQFVISVA